MRKSIAITLISVTGWIGAAAANPEKTTPEVGTGIGQRVPRLSAQTLDVTGEKAKPGEFDSHRTERVTAYIVVGTKCPATQAYADRLQHLEKDYHARGVDFVYIYPNREDTLEAKIAFHKEKKLIGSLIDDQRGKIARQLAAQRTSEVFVTDRKGVIVYHGAIDDARDATAVQKRYLAAALDETLAGKAVTVPTSQVLA
jgi:hypothetical protein